MSVALDERHQIGGNLPIHLKAFEAHKAHIEDLIAEARNFCDGDPVTTEGQSAAVSKLIDDLRKAWKAADDSRVKEKKPLDDQIAEIQARWNPYIQKDKGKVDLSISALKAALAPYLKRLDDEKQAALKAARDAAEEAARQAAEAMRAANPANLEDRENAEELVQTAKRAEATANRAANDKAHATGGERAMGLRTVWTATLTDPAQALKHYIATRPDDLRAVLQRFADEDVRAGKRDVPGFQIQSEKRL